MLIQYGIPGTGTGRSTETICIFPDEQERQKLFAYLNELDIEYHKPYKRFDQTVKVPRGQASFTLHDDIHYNYYITILHQGWVGGIASSMPLCLSIFLGITLSLDPASTPVSTTT